MPRNVKSEEFLEAIKQALEKLFKSTKTCSFEQIKQQIGRWQFLIIKNSHMRVGVWVQHAALSNIIHGVWVPKSSPDHPEYDHLSLLVAGGGPHKKLRKSLIYEAAKSLLGKEPTQLAYQKILQELCEFKGSS